MIGEPIRQALNAEDTSFHGMGREDIDVRCLGSGRPFVLEIKNPLIREHDLDELVSLVNANSTEKVEIDSLEWTNKKRVAKVKQYRSEKSYTIRFKTSEALMKRKPLQPLRACQELSLSKRLRREYLIVGQPRLASVRWCQ